MDKPLKFIHITKTAGTSIENIGLSNNIRWGRCHKEYGWWHEFFPKKAQWLKDKYDWFMVVRNPYDRILSEFYCKWTKISNKQTTDVQEFNYIIQFKISRRSTTGDHWSEQYKYLDPNYSIQILKFENLENEFTQLMNKYNLNISLNKHNNRSSKIFTIEDFSRSTLDKINHVYEKDFIEFNYTIQ